MLACDSLLVPVSCASLSSQPVTLLSLGPLIQGLSPGEQTWLSPKGMDIETQGRSHLLLSEPVGCSLDFDCALPYRNGDSELVSPLW